MAIAPVNKFISLAVPVAPGLQKLYEVPTGTSALLLYTQVTNVGIAVTYPTVTFVQRRTSRSTGNNRDVRVIKDIEVPPNDAAIIVDGRLVLEKTPLVLDEIYVQGTQEGVGIIQNVTYHEPSGIATITTKENHNLSVSDPITLRGIFFECTGSTGITTNIFPDPQQSFVVDSVIDEGPLNVGTSKTFSAIVGTSKGYPHIYKSAIHYFERAKDNAVEIVDGNGGYNKVTPTNASYNPTTGFITFTVNSHGFNVGDKIRIDDYAIKFTCSEDNNATEHDYPRPTDYASDKILEISSKNNNTFTMFVGKSSNTTTHTFVSAVANSVKKINVQLDVLNAVYNGGPGTQTIHGISLTAGELRLFFTTPHNLTGTSNKIRIVLNSIVFTCTMDDRLSEHPYPRKSDQAKYGKEINASIQSSTSLAVNVGASSSGGFFAPLQMELVASILENSTA